MKRPLIGLAIALSTALAPAAYAGQTVAFRMYWKKGGAGKMNAPAPKIEPWKLAVVKKFANGDKVVEKDWVDLGRFLAEGDNSISVADTRALVKRLQQTGHAIALDPVTDATYAPYNAGYGGPDQPGTMQIVSLGARVKFSYFHGSDARPTNGTGIVVQLGSGQSRIRVATVGPDGKIHAYAVNGTTLEVLASGEGAERSHF
jgi:hypothetical protein